MAYSLEWIDFKDTDILSPLMSDYIARKEKVHPFYNHYPNFENIPRQIAEKKNFPSAHRTLLHEYLTKTYADSPLSEAQKTNIGKILSPDTFTITTAHQPNIFTGYLYMIYKIVHTIKTCTVLQKTFPNYHFIPFFFMGSEDHDTEELSSFHIHNKKFVWQSTEEGAFGRRTCNKAISQLIHTIQNELKAYPYVQHLVSLLEDGYAKHKTIEQATFHIINALFQNYGLLIITPDNPSLKKAFSPFMEKDILQNETQSVAEKTIARLLEKKYKVQAYPRPINFFYYKAHLRERIIFEKGVYKINNTNLQFSQAEMEAEIKTHPERFSPNVFLRGLMQEYLLPNLMYIGGGGEIAYWLELKAIFTHYNIPFPLLKIRASFILLDDRNIIRKLRQEQWKIQNILAPESVWIEKYLIPETKPYQKHIRTGLEKIASVYENLSDYLKTENIDLSAHLANLEARHSKKITALEKKIKQAYKKKNKTISDRKNAIRSHIFPNGIFQERFENFMPYYARYGKDFIPLIMDNLTADKDGIMTISIH